MKAIVIGEPWISLILGGEKAWEMRSRAWRHQGPVALIRKGSGHVVGVVQMLGSLPEITSQEAFAASEPQHRIPSAEQELAFSKGWRTPWVLKNAHALICPVLYKHKKGWMSPFSLEEQADVICEIQKQLNEQWQSSKQEIMYSGLRID